MEKRATVTTSSNRSVSANRSAPSNRPPNAGRKGKGATRSRILGLAFGAGSLAALLAYFWLQSLSAPRKTARAATTVPVLTVARDIPARTQITADMVQVRFVPTDQARAGTLRDASEVVGKVTTVSIANGHPVTPQAIAPPDINMGMAFTLPPNYRAVSVALDPVSAVAGFIKPGDHVDVLATFKNEGSQSITCVVLQNILLMATGSKVLPGYSAPDKPAVGTSPTTPSAPDAATPEEVPTATLMVNPEEAQALVLAASSGKIQLTLRSPNDKTRPTLAVLPSTFFTRGRNSGQPPAKSPFHLPQPFAGIRQTPVVTQVAPRVTQKSEAVKVRPALPQETSKAQPTAPPRPTREIALAGVMIGEDGFALLTSGKKEWCMKIGDAFGQYRVREITEDGIWVQPAKGQQELWHVGDTRTVLE